VTGRGKKGNDEGIQLLLLQSSNGDKTRRNIVTVTHLETTTKKRKRGKRVGLESTNGTPVGETNSRMKEGEKAGMGVERGGKGGQEQGPMGGD